MKKTFDRCGIQGAYSVHGVHMAKKRVTISVEELNYQPVRACCNLLGREFSAFVNAVCGMLARELRGCNMADLEQCKNIMDDFLDRCRKK
jgi:hypothetical protein